VIGRLRLMWRALYAAGDTNSTDTEMANETCAQRTLIPEFLHFVPALVSQLSVTGFTRVKRWAMLDLPVSAHVPVRGDPTRMVLVAKLIPGTIVFIRSDFYGQSLYGTTGTKLYILFC